MELTFRCVDSYEVTSWVASWRESVKVLEPESLREKLAEFGEWLVETYDDRTQPSARGTPSRARARSPRQNG